MDFYLPDPKNLGHTGEVDYYHWNYQFPIKYIQKLRFKGLIRLMGNRIYDRILEVGTGSGIFLPELDRHCKKLHAIDIHPKMTSVKKLCQIMSIDADLKQCSIEDTNYPDDFFDLIIAVSVLEFINNLENALTEIKRILKPEGMFLTNCPQQSKMLDLILNLYTKRTPDEEFGESRSIVYKELEKQFSIINKKIFPPVLGKIFPIYYFYKLKK